MKKIYNLLFVSTALLVLLSMQYLPTQNISSIAFANELPSTTTAWDFPIKRSQVRPVATFNGKAVEIKRINTSDSEDTYALIGNDNTKYGEIRILTESNDLLVTLSALKSGDFSYGVSLAGKVVRMADQSFTRLTKSSAAYYPYNPNSSQQKNGGTKPANGELGTADYELFMPGVILDSAVIVNDSESLYRVRVNKNSNLYSVIFMRQREVAASGRDSVSERINLTSGQTDQIKLISSPSVKKLQLKKFGSPRAIKGTIVQIPFRNWGSTDEGEYLDDTVLNQVAQKFKIAGVDHVQLKLNEPKPEIAQTIKDNGMVPHFYMFLGVARERNVNGKVCYSLMARDGARCVNSWLIRNSAGSGYYSPGNDSWALIDIRNPEYRAFLVDQAVYAIENGYEGVFLDGPQLWVDSKGRVGGSNTKYALSWYHARAILLEETREAVRKVKPTAYVGILGNRYMDFQASADYVLDEVVKWKEYTDEPAKRQFIYNKDLVDEAVSKSNIVATNYVLGIKGNNAAQVASLYKYAKSKGINVETKYIDIGDFKIPFALKWADVTSKVVKGQ